MNKSGNANRSVRNTKSKIKQGTFELLKTHCIKDVSVKELTEMINISRGTFYCHYSDVYQVVEEIEDELIVKIEEIVNSIGDTPDDDIATDALEQVFIYLQGHIDFIKIILNEDNPLIFLKRLKDTLNDTCANRWSVLHNQTPPEDYTLFNAFLINGIQGLIEYWISSGMQETPRQLASFAANFIAYGVSNEQNLILNE